MARTNKHEKDRKRAFTCPGCLQPFSRKHGLQRHLQRFMPTPEDLAARFACFVDDCAFDPQVQKVNRDKHVQYQHPDVWLERTGLVPVKKPRKVRKAHEDTSAESTESTQEEEQVTFEQPIVLPGVPSVPSYSAAEPQTSFVLSSLVYPHDIFVPAAPPPTDQSPPYFWSQVPPAPFPAHQFPPFPMNQFQPFPVDQFQSSPCPAAPPAYQPSPWIPTRQLHQPTPVRPPQSFNYFFGPQTSTPRSFHDLYDQDPQI